MVGKCPVVEQVDRNEDKHLDSPDAQRDCGWFESRNEVEGEPRSRGWASEEAWEGLRGDERQLKECECGACELSAAKLIFKEVRCVNPSLECTRYALCIVGHPDCP